MNRRRFLQSIGGGAMIALPGVFRPLEARRARPAEVLLIRHAEEPDKGPELNDRGRDRAKALVKLFPSRFPKPTVLFAARTTKESSRSMETLEPLAAALALPVDDRYLDSQYDQLALLLLSEPRYSGGHILICWHRETLPALAAALGAPNPPKWPSPQYDRIWVIRYTGTKATLSEEPQRLLKGDR